MHHNVYSRSQQHLFIQPWVADANSFSPSHNFVKLSATLYLAAAAAATAAAVVSR